MFQFVLLRPEAIPDDEGVGGGEIGHGRRVQLAIFWKKNTYNGRFEFSNYLFFEPVYREVELCLGS